MADSLQSSHSIPNHQKFELIVAENPASGAMAKDYEVVPYNPQREYDYVRLVVTIGLLALFGFVVVWVAFKSSASDEVWRRTKDMLQIVMPALTALIGSVLGFYFGSQKGNIASQ
jgi:uncharacterized membrane protein YsdA (DUF1294 family)